jgi:hypothetical protein
MNITFCLFQARAKWWFCCLLAVHIFHDEPFNLHIVLYSSHSILLSTLLYIRKGIYTYSIYHIIVVASFSSQPNVVALEYLISRVLALHDDAGARGVSPPDDGVGRRR